MPYVYSTITNSTFYTQYRKTNANALGVIEKKVLIKGGHGVAVPKTIMTPWGVPTEVSDADLEFLLQNEAFQRHMKAGFITVDKKEVKAEKKAVDMNLKDGSQPLTPKDFDKSQNSDENTKIYKTKKIE